MADRSDVLRELGLIPVWRLRSRPADVVEPSGRRDSAAAAPPALTPRTEERIVRIAALGWSDFAADVRACTACGLCRSRRQAVPGVGDAGAEWMFIGEAPGAEEDARGEPFVGQAGRLRFTHRRQRGIGQGAHRPSPPGNRTPDPGEVDACRPYLDRQIALIRPKLIVALGRSAATTLLAVDASIASLRGRVHRYQGLPLIVTYHPAYLLRNLPDKAKAWEDLCLARATVRALHDAGGLQSAAAAPN